MPFRKLALAELDAFFFVLTAHVLQTGGCETALSANEGGALGDGGCDKGFKIDAFGDQGLDAGG